MAGWIKLNRQIENHWVWANDPFSRGQAWVDLLLLAVHKDTVFMIKGVTYELKRGQLSRSMLTLSKRWQWSRGKVKRFLDLLECEQMITVMTDTKTTVITICNYSDYQGFDISDSTTGVQRSIQPTVQRSIQQTVQQTDTKKHDLSGCNERQIDLIEIVDDTTVDTTDEHQSVQRSIQPTVHIQEVKNKRNKENIYKLNDDEILEVWNGFGCTKHRSITEKAKKNIKKCYDEYLKQAKKSKNDPLPITEWACSYLINGFQPDIKPWMQGQGDQGWKASIEYAFRFAIYDEIRSRD